MANDLARRAPARGDAALTRQMADMTGRTVMIAGGAGFLGSWLCRAYADRNARVICVDNLSTGRMRNIAHLQDNAGFRFLHQDIVRPFDPGEPIGFLFSMACPASPPRYEADPIGTFNSSVIGSENLLALARDRGARILQASTSEVYGDPTTSPQSETYRGNVNTMGQCANSFCTQAVCRYSLSLGTTLSQNVVVTHKPYRIDDWKHYVSPLYAISKC